MTRKHRALYCGEWVRARPYFGSHKATGHCSVCDRRSLAVGWHSIRSREFRCVRCFDAEAAHHQ